MTQRIDMARALPQNDGIVLTGAWATYFVLALFLIVPFIVFDLEIEWGGYFLAVAFSGFFIGSLARRDTLLAFFNACQLFIVIVPFVFQYAFYININGFGQSVTPLSWITIATYFGYVGIVNFINSLRTANGPRQWAEEPMHDGGVGPVTAAIFAAFSVGLLFFIFGVEMVLTTRVDQIELLEEGSAFRAFVSDLLKLSPFAAAFLLGIGAKQPQRPGIVYVGLIFVGLIVCNPINTPRFLSLTGLLLALIPTIRYFGIFRQLPLLFMMGAFVILPLTSILRYGVEGDLSGKFLQIYESSEFSALQVLNDGFFYLADAGYSYGTKVLSGFLILVPRNLWEGKNEGTGVEIGELGHYPETNVGVSPHFEAYLDLGLIGVILFAIGTGFALKAIRNASRNFTFTGSVSARLSFVLLVSLPTFARGDWMTACRAFYSFFVIIMMIEAMRFLTARRQTLR